MLNTILNAILSINYTTTYTIKQDLKICLKYIYIKNIFITVKILNVIN